MKTSPSVVVLATRAHPARALAGRACSPALKAAWRVLRQVVFLAMAIALAQLAVRWIWSRADASHVTGSPPPAASDRGPAATALSAWARQGFRDGAPCDLSGEPLECR